MLEFSSFYVWKHTSVRYVIAKLTNTTVWYHARVCCSTIYSSLFSKRLSNRWTIFIFRSLFSFFNFMKLYIINIFMKLKCINYLLKLQDIETSNKMRVNITIAILIKDHWDEMKNIRIVKVSNNWPIIETWCIDRDKPHALDSNNWKKRRTIRKICWCIDPRRFQSSCFSHDVVLRWACGQIVVIYL